MQAIKIMVVEIAERLYQDFIDTVTKEGGPWRNRRREQTFNEAVKTAVSAALTEFLKSLDGKSRLPEFRDYVVEKYPELDEDLVTMMEDLIKRQKEKAGQIVSRGNHDSAGVPSILRSRSLEKGGDRHGGSLESFNKTDTGFKLPERDDGGWS
jgi:hypothetical protein